MISSVFADFEALYPTIPFDINFVDPPEDWLVEQWLLRNRMNFITGDPKAGKSRLFRYLLMRVFTQRPAIESLQVGPRPKKILWLAAEEKPGSINRELINLAKLEGLSPEELQAAFPQWLHYKSLIGYNMERNREQAYIKSVIEQGGYDMVIMDPFRSINAADENKSTDVIPILNAFRHWVNEHQLTMVIIHHSKKIGDDGQVTGPADVLRGSSAIAGAADMVLFVNRRENGDRKKHIPGKMTITPMSRQAPDDPIDILDGHDEDFAFRFDPKK